MKLIDVLVLSNHYKSKSDIRRAIEGNSIAINDVKVVDTNADISYVHFDTDEGKTFMNLIESTGLNIDWNVEGINASVWVLREKGSLKLIGDTHHFHFTINENGDAVDFKFKKNKP